MNQHQQPPEQDAQANPDAPRTKAVDVFFGEKFTRTLFRPARHKALYGGRGSGKSFSVATWLVIEACKQRLRNVCARQFQNSIRDSSKELIERRIRDLNLSAQFTMQERAIVHNGTGSDFLFIGLERNVESIRSLEGADRVWVEEARTTNAKSLEILLPTVRKKGSELIWTWNPELPDDPVDAMFRGKDGPPPNSIVTPVNYRDNPFFHGTELSNEMEVLRRGNLHRFKHVWEGEYDLRHESKVFPNARIGQIAVNSDEMPPRYGMDFGFGSDPSFVVKMHVNDMRKQIYIAQEACGRVSMDELPGMVRRVIEHDRDLVRADSSQPGTIEFLNNRGLNVVGTKKGPGSIKSGINFLQSYDLIIDPSCEHLRNEARLYSWQMDRLTGKIINTPCDTNNHGWDASRYAVEDLALEGAEIAGSDPYGGVMKLFKGRKW